MNRTSHAMMLCLLLFSACGGANSPAATASNADTEDAADSAPESTRDSVIRQANELFERLRTRPWTARITGCASRDCNDGTVYMQIPGRARIEYDYGSTVVADGSTLYTYNRATEVDRRALDETEIGVLLAGDLGGDVTVEAVQELDRGPDAGDMRRVHRVDLERNGQRVTLLFAKEPFQFIGWMVDGDRGAFTAELRDFRATDPEVNMFRPLPSDG